MKTNFKCLLAIAMLVLPFQSYGAGDKEPVDDVYMYIGTINPKTRGAIPVIKYPGGNVGLFPTFTPGFTDMYLADKIYGFSFGTGSLMITSGNISAEASENASRFDHDMESATPYYYQVLLEDSDINSEFTVTDNAILFRFTIPAGKSYNVILSSVGNGSIIAQSNSVLTGEGSSRRSKDYFYAELSRPASKTGVLDDNRAYASYPASDKEQIIEVRVGVSPDGLDEARAAIAKEIGTKSFGELKQAARDAWNKELSVINVKGGSDKARSLFYTTLHRTRALRMGNVWDTYRSAYPLLCLIRPEEANKVIRDFVSTYEKTGWLPSSGAMIGNHSTAVIVDAYMRGVRDYDIEKAYAGMRKNATEGTMIPWKDAGYVTELEQCYFDKGFFPALTTRSDANSPTFDSIKNRRYEKLPYQVRWEPEVGVDEWVAEVDRWHRRQSVSVTLEHCYDDWCLAQIAKSLGKTDDYELFMKRAHNYQNLFKPSIGLMAPKSADGAWIEPFDPKYSGGFAGEAYFAEGNSWIYTWHVQHDVQGLANLMGGNAKFIEKLDELFTTSHSMDKLEFQAHFPDMTGLIGMYCHGNEPAFHIPYMYNYVGEPWKTQSRVRQIMDLWYDLRPDGISGDEDGGAMSSWYVFSSIGIYPQCPGQPIFDIGSPVFEEVMINVGHGKTFTIEAKDVSSKNKYIQSAMLNGHTYDKPWISHADIVAGGKLVFQMGPRPNKSWGSAPAAAAPSMSRPN